MRQGLLIGGLFGLSFGLLFGLSLGLVDGLIWGFCGVFISLVLMSRPTTIVPTEILVWSWKRLWGSLKQREHRRKALLLALVTGLSVGLSWGLSWGLSQGLIVAGSYWLLFGLFQGVSSTTFREQQRTIPNWGTHRSGRNGLVLGIVAAIIVALIVGLDSIVNYGLNWGLVIGLRAGLSYGLSNGWKAGLAAGLLVTLLLGGLAWWRHWVLRFLLWRSGALPWRLVPLLDEAAQRILLRRVGGGYRFIHDLFRDYLATLDSSMLSGSVTQAAPHHEETVPSSQ